MQVALNDGISSVKAETEATTDKLSSILAMMNRITGKLIGNLRMDLSNQNTPLKLTQLLTIGGKNVEYHPIGALKK